MSKQKPARVTRRDVLMTGAAASAALTMSSIYAFGTADASPTSGSQNTRGTNMQSTDIKPSIVFCHGVWADGSSFSKVIPALRAEGHQVIAAQYGLDTLAGDVATVKHTLGRVSSPVVLVGHSYGGSVITAAGTDSRVAALVYIAALAPDADETTQSQLDKYPKTDVLAHVEVANGRVWMRPDGVASFAGDLPEQEQRLVWSTQYAPAADLFTQKVEGVAWRSKPNWYIVATNDRTVQPDLERFLAKRMRATTTEVPSSHVAMLSHPKAVLEVIRAAAQAVQTSANAA
jgi:pimeloyl-ACP methyl ester carboxylesterase